MSKDMIFILIFDILKVIFIHIWGWFQSVEMMISFYQNTVYRVLYLLPDLEYARLPVPLMVHTSLSALEPETNWKRLRKFLRRGWKKENLFPLGFVAISPLLCNIAFSANSHRRWLWCKVIRKPILARKIANNFILPKVPCISQAHLQISIFLYLRCNRIN